MNTATKILTVDDNLSNLIALQAVFSGSGYELVEATSGQEALTLLEKHMDIAVVLLDVQMPVMDGFETALKIKLIPAHKNIPIIFITAVFQEDPYVTRGYKVGAVDYFSKPFDPDILKMKVEIYSKFKQNSSLLEERERRVLETEEILKAGRKLSSILETLTVGVLISDANGYICQTNEVVSKILKTNDAIESDNYGEVLGWWDGSGKILKGKDSPLSLALSLGKSADNQLIEIKCQDGSFKTIVASASPLKALDRHVVGAVVVIQDLTETKKIEQELEGKISGMISSGIVLEHHSSPS